jgi:hypothetical protein
MKHWIHNPAERRAWWKLHSTSVFAGLMLVAISVLIIALTHALYLEASTWTPEDFGEWLGRIAAGYNAAVGPTK